MKCDTQPRYETYPFCPDCRTKAEQARSFGLHEERKAMNENCGMNGCNAPEGECSGACVNKDACTHGRAEAPSVDTILAERGKRYGKFTGHAQLAMSLKSKIRWHREVNKMDKLADDQQEALDMICHKIGRIVNGDPNYADSWVDIAGYAKLVADRLQGLER